MWSFFVCRVLIYFMRIRGPVIKLGLEGELQVSVQGEHREIGRRRRGKRNTWHCNSVM